MIVIWTLTTHTHTPPPLRAALKQITKFSVHSKPLLSFLTYGIMVISPPNHTVLVSIVLSGGGGGEGEEEEKREKANHR